MTLRPDSPHITAADVRSDTVSGMDAITTLLAGGTPDLHALGTAQLVPLAACWQTRAFHGEGDVATHTAMVLDIADETAGAAACPSAGTLTDMGTVSGAAAWAPTVLRLGSLFHDVGKPGTTTQVEPGVVLRQGIPRRRRADRVHPVRHPTRGWRRFRWGCTRPCTRWCATTCGPTTSTGAHRARCCG